MTDSEKVPFFEKERRPGVGLSSIIVREGKVLLGLRKGSHGTDTWAFPGGKLDWEESFEECVRRETEEETGLVVGAVRPSGHFTNDVFEDEDKHFITLHMLGEYTSGEAQLREPEKCERWEWFGWDEFPENLFLPVQHLRNQGYRPPGC